MPGLKNVWFAVALLGGLAMFPAVVQAAGTDVPRYRVDPFWPKELPNNWIMGQVGGVAVDGQDHIWVLQRPRTSDAKELGLAQTPPATMCCAETPSLLEFDRAGTVLRSWGGPKFVADWPKNEHAVFVDKTGNVWISGNGRGDRQVLKFTPDGKQLLEIGHPSDGPRNNQDTSILGQPAGIFVDDTAHEVYIADGYLNNRVVVYDSETGVFKRGWGAYGIALDQVSNDNPTPHAAGAAPAKQFNTPVHCVRMSVDGLLYVCDRQGDRVQVFTKDGKFQKEFLVRTETLAEGSAFTIAFSHDRGQKYLFLADGGNNVIHILRREDGVEVGQIGHAGRNAGQFHELHQIAMDSKGDIYTGEADTGKRVQKFSLLKAGK